MEDPHPKTGRRDPDRQGRPRRPAHYLLLLLAGVFVLLGIGIAHDHHHINLASSLLLYAVVLAVIVAVSRPGAE